MVFQSAKAGGASSLFAATFSAKSKYLAIFASWYEIALS